MSRRAPDDATILATLRSGPPRALHVSELASVLEVPFSGLRDLHEALGALVARGLLSALPGQRFRLPRTRGARVEGRFAQHPKGFAFVAASDGGDDVYIAPGAVQGAMHGDLVACEAVPGPRGREGVVLEVVTRRAPRIPGTLRVKPLGAIVEPDDPRLRGPVQVTSVGTAHDGDAVVCEVDAWPSRPGEAPTGHVNEALGTPGELSVEVRKVLLREAVDERFDDAVEAEARAYGDRVPEEALAAREDLRAIPFVTIDPEDARDHDDAIHVAPLEGGGWTVRVAIADVSYYVRPGTQLDRAALQRGTSLYLPDRAVPMLPAALSGHLASLVEGEDRLVLGVEATLTDDGEVRSSRLFEAVLRCAAGLTYPQVAAALGWTHGDGAPAVTDAVRALLADTAACAAKLRQGRVRRGALDLDLPEGRVRFGDDGETPEDVVQSRADPGLKRAYQLVEELMLLANEVVARACVAADAPAIFRVHGSPDEEHLSRFAAVAQAYGHKVDIEVGRAPKKLSALLRRVQGEPEGRVLAMLLLRSLPQARYATVNTGHFGLASEAYLHFTSPIRRYPDLVVHRVVRALLRGEHIARDEASRDAMTRAAAESSRLERRAMEVEREVLDLYRCVVAREHLGEVRSATVTGVTTAGPFVDVDNPFCSGLVKVDGVPPDAWELDELGIRVRVPGTNLRYMLGEVKLVTLSEVSVQRRAITFKPAEPLDDKSLRKVARKAEERTRGRRRK